MGLTEPHRIWASTIDQADVDIMKERSQNGASLLESHIFQFDFLNDDMSKCPDSLKKIIHDDKKRKQLVIYINPPYAEASDRKQISGTGQNKSGVAKETRTYKLHKDSIGTAARELYAQFLIRIFSDFSDCLVANFSKLKNLQASNFKKFRNIYTPKLKKLFIAPANTFDNVKGQFPIGFFVWDTGKSEKFTSIVADIFDKDAKFIGDKNIYCYDNKKFVIEWLRNFYDKKNYPIGYLNIAGTDVQNNKRIFVSSFLSDNAVKEKLYTPITKHNLIEMCIYVSIRHIIYGTWINDRDQYLYPLPTWEDDEYFKTNCLTYTLFDNIIQSKDGINHWIPFTEKEVNAKDCFDSHFMTDYMKGKLKSDTTSSRDSLIKSKSSLLSKPLSFSDEAQSVFDAGRELWRYYHTRRDAGPNASLYDIKEYFQGRNENGRMNSSCEDEKYNALMDILREKLKALAREIEPKVYEHGFLLR